jgi:uncharacterized repeat protein (TIGR01451 family)
MIVFVFLVSILGVVAAPVTAYNPGATYTFDASTPNYNPDAAIYPGVIDRSCMLVGDYLGRSSIQPLARGWGDSGVSINWDDHWLYGIGDGNANGDELDGKWVHVIGIDEGWWDLGFPTDRVAVFLSQDHGPYLAEGLETRVHGANSAFDDTVGGLATLTDVYLDGWRTHNSAEDSNSNGWCSDDIAGVYQLDGLYQYVRITPWDLTGALNEPEVDAIGAFRVFDKSLSADEGELGDTVHVTLTVSGPPGETVTVEDTLPEGFAYVKGTFTVNSASDIPNVEKGVMTYSFASAGTDLIEFDVKVDEAKNWEDMEVCNTATATWFENCEPVCELEDTACFVIHPFEQLRKSIGLPKADVVFAIDLTGSMGNEINTVKAEASNIMASLATQIADVQFGLMSYMDYVGTYSTTEPGSNPETYTATYGVAYWGDYPYSLDQGLTDNTAQMNIEINALTLGSGADGPQDYTRIIHEAWNDPNLLWREGAERFLIIFGDNVPHDTEFDINNNGYPDNRGGDPGRDTVLGTSDDLDFETEVGNAAENDIHIMSVYSGGWGLRYAWEYMAEETDGGYFQLSDASMIPDAITEFVEAQIEETLLIEEKTETQWAIVFEVTNPFGYTMEEVVITDRFGGEIEIDDADPEIEGVNEVSITHGTWSYYTKGKSEKVFLTWDIGDLDPGETALLIVLVSTDLNPAGKQEYTSPGFYELNSGATLKFIDSEQDMQLSAYTNSIGVRVTPEERLVVAVDFSHRVDDLYQITDFEDNLALWGVDVHIIEGTFSIPEDTNVLLVPASRDLYTPDELDAIEDWFSREDGPSLLWVAGDSDYYPYTFHFTPDACNGILDIIGANLRLSADTVEDHDNNDGAFYRVAVETPISDGSLNSIFTEGVSSAIFHGPTSVLGYEEGNIVDLSQNSIEDVEVIMMSSGDANAKEWDATGGLFDYYSQYHPLRGSYPMMAVQTMGEKKYAIASGEVIFSDYMHMYDLVTAQGIWNDGYHDGKTLVDNIIFWYWFHL